VRALFDQGTLVPLRESLGEHDVSTAYERGWSTLKNGDLIDAAEREGFEVLLTTDYSPECVEGEFSEVCRHEILSSSTLRWCPKFSPVAT
jgi:hypothetical protein